MRNSRAFTLIEILIAVALSSLTIIILSKSIFAIIKLQKLSNNQLKAIHLAHKAMEDIEITKDCESGEGIYTKTQYINVKYKYEVSTKEYKLNFDNNFENNVYQTKYCKIFVFVNSNTNGETLYKLYSERRL